MEIRYERAYGGRDETSIQRFRFLSAEPWALVSYAAKQRDPQGLALPNLEDPNDLLTPERIIVEDPENWHQQPLPQRGLVGFSARGIRAVHASSYPAYIDVDT